MKARLFEMSGHAFIGYRRAFILFFYRRRRRDYR